MATPNVYFDINIGGKPAGRITFRLFDDVVPSTARNFRELATSQNGYGYRGSHFHRIIPQALHHDRGDITNYNGTGGRSIYGETFPENFKLNHERPFVLSMANTGPDTNGSQFFITTIATTWLNGKHCVFGEVIEGQELIKRIEALGSSLGSPKETVVVADCGTL